MFEISGNVLMFIKNNALKTMETNEMKKLSSSYSAPSCSAVTLLGRNAILAFSNQNENLDGHTEIERDDSGWDPTNPYD